MSHYSELQQGFTFALHGSISKFPELIFLCISKTCPLIIHVDTLTHAYYKEHLPFSTFKHIFKEQINSGNTKAGMSLGL